MRDAGEEYPLHQPEHNEHHHLLDGQSTPTPAQELPTGQSEQRPLHQREIASSPQLPGGRLRKTLIAGVLCAAQGIVIVLANAALYQSASTTALAKLTFDTALTILSIQALIYLISVLICLVGGFVVGKIVVQRRLGFLAGFIAGLIIYGTGFLLNYIPSLQARLSRHFGVKYPQDDIFLTFAFYRTPGGFEAEDDIYIPGILEVL